MKAWITVKALGTVFTTDDADEAEEKFKEWSELQEAEVILFADFDDGTGAVIWKRH